MSYQVLGLGQPLLDRILQVDESVMVKLGITERGGSSLITDANELEAFKSHLQEVIQGELSSSQSDREYACATLTNDSSPITTTCPHAEDSVTSSSGNVSDSDSEEYEFGHNCEDMTHSPPLSPTSPYYRIPKPVVTPNVKKAIIVPGGSCANTIKGLASLGEKCGFIGKIGRDSVGQLYKDSMSQRGVIPLMTESINARTGEVICLITPNGERTMKAFLGASLQMTENDLLPQDFAGVKLLHVEGYSIYNEPLTLKAMQLAKQNGSMVSLDLGSFELVRQFKPLLLDMLRNYVDIVFSNSEEARELMGGVPGRDVPEKCVDYLAKYCKVAVVMMGKDGCWVKSGNEKYKCPADVVANPIDTTGAGDLFAAGFLYAYLQGYTLQQCARMGALSGKEVLFVMGAEVPMDRFSKIKARVNSSVFVNGEEEHKSRSSTSSSSNSNNNTQDSNGILQQQQVILKSVPKGITRKSVGSSNNDYEPVVGSMEMSSSWKQSSQFI